MKNDDIKQILQGITPPEPTESAKKLALAKALAEFDKKNQNTTQGTLKTSRLMNMLNQLDRRINMKKAYYYGASITTIALTLGVLTYSEFTSPVGKPFSNIGSSLSVAKSAAPTAVVIPEPVAISAPPPAQSNRQDAAKSLSPAKKEFGQLKSSDALQVGNESAMIIAAPTPAVPAMADMKTRAFSEKSAFSTGGAPGFAPPSPPPGIDYYNPQQYEGNDKFEKVKTNSIKLVTQEPVSTFSIDVDTSSYSFIRRELNLGVLPPKDAVRVEEMVNYFDYNYALPDSKSQPFKPSITVLPSPWHAGNKLVHIGIKGFDIAPTEKPRSNLVFLIDTSGSMASPDRLPLVINSLRMLVNTLDDNDTVSIVTYAGWAGTALEPTKIRDKQKILSVLDNLQSGGSTAGAEGIRQAYALAEKSYDKNGVNRVILATDGDFNVGITDPNELQNFIEQKRDSGVFLSVLGVGQGNYNDAMMQKLAQNGNGNAAYIDNINEARKVLVQEAGSTLFPIAKDVKIQVEFNKDKVSEYRLIGYETRLLNREDFNNDKVDAGEVGSGHAVTAIYEITPKGAHGSIDEPRYGSAETDKSSVNSKDEYGFLKIRYKLPKESTSKLLTTPITTANEVDTIAKAPQDVRFATSVAAFGQLLHGDSYIGDFKYDDVAKLAAGAKGEDKFGYRAEFINLVNTAKLSAQKSPVTQPPEPPVPQMVE